MSSVSKNIQFDTLGLAPELLSRLAELNYSEPTQIQQRSIPHILQGQDLLAGAKTGSGKTAAFAIPLLQRHLLTAETSERGNYVNSLILVPTRELAQQITDSLISYSVLFARKPKIVTVLGGVSINAQMLKLRGGADFIVATPGRLLDLIASNAVKLSKVKHLVLDEADRMLGLGFADELNQIIKLLPKKRQTLLFSATFPDEIISFADALLNAPVKVQLEQTVETINQRVITVNKPNKTALLAHLIKENNWQQVLVFASAKRTCDHLASKLAKRGITAEVFHSDKAQNARTKLLSAFKTGDIKVLIATDIAARGIDIQKLPVVINFELPRSPADYTHRIGRCGRAGENGEAISLISHDEFHHFNVIDKKNKLELVKEQIIGFEADDEAPLDCPSRDAKPMAKPEGTGKKKRKNKPAVNVDIWGSKTK
ncbi:DEAD/DEAH box helicase [Shewanella marina]|uniref:DEAD/DEAH box helicase n=1 Tax=Shewanella marina TaxID=487319 RepID=UPI000471B660|nr:DEAD/DEAH box helicase [Shewanella marina]